MTEPDPKRGAQLLFERNERTFERFNALRGLSRKRMNWIDWLWDLREALAVALRVGDTQDAIEADLRADAAARVQDLLYWDARGSTPWATVPNANSARPDDARGSTPWGGGAPLTAQEDLRDLPMLAGAGVRALEQLARVAVRFERVQLRRVPESYAIELARRVAEELEQLEIVSASPVGSAGLERAKVNARELLRRLEEDREQLAPSAPPEAWRTSDRELTYRRGTEPHAWKELAPLSSGARIWHCDRCDMTIQPSPSADALAVQDCPGKIV